MFRLRMLTHQSKTNLDEISLFVKSVITRLKNKFNFWILSFLNVTEKSQTKWDIQRHVSGLQYMEYLPLNISRNRSRPLFKDSGSHVRPRNNVVVLKLVDGVNPLQQLNWYLVGSASPRMVKILITMTQQMIILHPQIHWDSLTAYILRIFDGSVHEKEACSQCSRQGEENLVQGRLAARTDTRLYASTGLRKAEIAEN